MWKTERRLNKKEENLMKRKQKNYIADCDGTEEQSPAPATVADML